MPVHCSPPLCVWLVVVAEDLEAFVLCVELPVYKRSDVVWCDVF